MNYFQTWTCQTCLTQVREDIYPCPNCMAKQMQDTSSKSNKNLCPVCTYENSEFITHCQICQHAFIQIPKQLQNKPSASVVCKNCNKQNHATNQTCVYCETDLFQQPKKRCPVCEVNVKTRLYDQHLQNCRLNSAVLQQELKEQRRMEEEALEKQKRLALKNLEECIHCRQKVMPHEAASHMAICRQKATKSLVFDQKTRMTKLQIQAVNFMHTMSQKQHNSVKSALQQRVKKLGYSIEDLNNLQFYIENYAPIIIHCHISKHMQFFIKDTHYRSQFQTNKSSGSLSRASRTTWENRMFSNKYSKATDYQRVKYGVINFTNDPKGVNCCSSYGASYMLLKEHVRDRCTFTDMDSSSASASIATFKYCFKILSKMNDGQLKAAFDASKAKQISSSCTATYKQIQIHGPIQFSKDVQCIYANRNQMKTDKKLLDMVYQFSKNNGIDHDFF